MSGKVDYDELRPGDLTDPEWLNGIFGDLAVKSAVIGRTNLRPSGLRRRSFAVAASYAPTPVTEDPTFLAPAAWPIAFGAIPGATGSLTVPFDIPAHSRCRFRLSFELYPTVAAGVITPGVPTTATAEWRIAGTIGGVAWHDPFSEMWLSVGAPPGLDGIWGSAFSEAWYVTGNTAATVTLLRAECKEAAGATIQAGMLTLSATVFRRS